MFTIFIIILFVILLICRIAAGFFADVVPFFGALTVMLSWLCVIVGIIASIFVAIKIYNEFQNLKK